MVEILPEQDIPAPRTPQDLEVEMVNDDSAEDQPPLPQEAFSGQSEGHAKDPTVETDEETKPRTIRGSVGKLLQQQKRQATQRSAKPNNFMSQAARQLIKRTTAAKTIAKPAARSPTGPTTTAADTSSPPPDPQKSPSQVATDMPQEVSHASHPSIKTTPAEQKLREAQDVSSSAPELVHPTEEGGELSHASHPSIKTTPAEQKLREAQDVSSSAPELVHPTEEGGELRRFATIGKLKAGPHWTRRRHSGTCRQRRANQTFL
eukprot:s8048_g1.t1